jgi:hypothetical protein
MSANVALDVDPTMSAIRSILHEPAPSNAAPNLKAQRQEAIAASLHAADVRKVEIEKAVAAVVEDNAQPQEKSATSREKTQSKGQNKGQNKGKSSKGAVMSRLNLPFQAKRKHLVWAGFALAIVLRPHWFLLTVILTVILFFGAFAVFGASKTWGAIMWTFNILAGRSPERAKRFAKRMDRAAMRWDGFLDRLPEGMVDGLYLPDFQTIQAAEEQHDAVVDARLSRMRAEG